MVCLSADRFAENLLEGNGVDVKRSKLEGRKWNSDVEMDSGVSGPPATSRPDEGMPTATAPMEVPTVPPPAPPPQEHVHEMRGQGVHAKALRIRAFWSEIGRTPGCQACETPGPGKSPTRECKMYQDAWDESRRTASAEEAKRGIVGDPDTRPLDPSSSSTDPNWKRSKTTPVTDNENLEDRMDEDNFRRGPATSHQLEPVDDESVSKKARVARNVLHILGEDSVKFDVNEEAWPNADLVIRASYEGALIDGLPADKVKAGDEREIQQMKDLQLYSWVKETDIPPDKSTLLTGWARRLKGSEVRSRCVLKDFATTVRDDDLRQPHLHCQYLDNCCTQHGSIFEWKLETLCVLSCKQTHPVKCSLDLRKDKNVMDGSGDYMGR